MSAGALHTPSPGGHLLKKSLSPRLRLRDGSGCNSAVRGWLYAVLHRHRRSQGVGRNLQKNEARNFFPPMGFEPTENDLSGGLLAPYPITRKNLLASGLRQWDSNPITSFSGAALGPCLTSQRVHLGHKSERIIRRLFLNKNAASNDWSTAPVFWLVSILEPPRRGIDCPGRCILLNRSRNGMRRNHATHRQTDRPGQSKPATTSFAFFKKLQNFQNFTKN